MIVWSGRGFLSVLIALVTFIASMKWLPKEHGDYAFVVTAFITAAFSGYFGYKWNNKNSRTLIDEQTGERIVLSGNHSLFWIKMEYWGVILAILGLVILFQNSIIAAVIGSILFLGVVALILRSSKGDVLEKANSNSSVNKNSIRSNRDVIRLNPDIELKNQSKD